MGSRCRRGPGKVGKCPSWSPIALSRRHTPSCLPPGLADSANGTNPTNLDFAEALQNSCGRHRLQSWPPGCAAMTASCTRHRSRWPRSAAASSGCPLATTRNCCAPPPRGVRRLRGARSSLRHGGGCGIRHDRERPGLCGPPDRWFPCADRLHLPRAPGNIGHARRQGASRTPGSPSSTLGNQTRRSRPAGVLAGLRDDQSLSFKYFTNLVGQSMHDLFLFGSAHVGKGLTWAIDGVVVG